MDTTQDRDTSQELAVLQRINHTLNATLNLTEVLRRIITELVALLAAHSASVILHDEGRQEAELTTTYGSTPVFHALRYPLAGSLTGWVAEHRQPLRVSRFTREEWPLVWQLAEQLNATPAPVAVLLVPLWVQKHVVGDPTRLRQVLVNLVGNAIKFTPHGEVLVQAAPQQVTEEEFMLRVRVSDTGIGIPREKQQHIFESFAQVDSSTSRHYGGSGLGLAISRQLVELMGGQMNVTSEVGQGATFTFTLRLGRGRTPAMCPTRSPDHLHGVRVLVVDDNAANRRILHDPLSAWRMQPVLASSAHEALSLLQEAQAQGHPFSLIVTDTHMPEMDGFTFVERLQQNFQLASATVGAWMILKEPRCIFTSSDARAQLHRLRGHHRFLYPKGHKIYEGHLKPFTAEDVARLKARGAAILREPKYHKMAELAEV